MEEEEDQDDEHTHGLVPHTDPFAPWVKGWRELTAGEAAEGVASVGGRWPLPVAFNLAPLPARHFCSGHLYWEQQVSRVRGER